MSQALKQHLIDPEICIRCYTCEATCPIQAITHNDENVVVDFDKCNHCMDCIAPCPTGSIDEWRVVTTPYTLAQQFEFEELPEQADIAVDVQVDTSIEALDESIAALLADAHKGAGGRATAPASASKPTVSLHKINTPANAVVQGNYRLTSVDSDSDVRHIILDLGQLSFPLLEGQSVGITAPGLNADGKPHLPRLYSVSSPRDGERPGHNNLSLTVKREPQGVCSNYICDLKKGDNIALTGPFGSTFLMPDDPQANILMICTGTGSAPFRGFTLRRQRTMPGGSSSNGNAMQLVFGARTPDSLPYFGPLEKVPCTVLEKAYAFSRVANQDKEYVQDKLLQSDARYIRFLQDPDAYIYICGLRAMEEGVDAAFEQLAASNGLDWKSTRDAMRDAGRYHVETY